MKKSLFLISVVAIFVLLTACNPFGPDPDPGPGPTPIHHKIDGTYTLTTPEGTLVLEDMATIYPDVIVNIPGQIVVDSSGFNYVTCNITNNTFNFHATKTYTNPEQTIDLTNFTVGADTITGTIKYNNTSVTVSGTRQ